MFYTVARFLLSLLFKICFRLKVFGRGNFPKKGPVIVAANHASFLDPIIVGIASPRKLNYIARNSLFKNRFFAKILYLVNTFPVKREQGDINAFKQALNKLSQGKPLVIFPEGTRSKDGDLQKPRHGIGFIHLTSGANILPCFINGSLQALPLHAKFPRPRSISVYFGRPLRFDKKFSGDKKIAFSDNVLPALFPKETREDNFEAIFAVPPALFSTCPCGQICTSKSAGKKTRGDKKKQYMYIAEQVMEAIGQLKEKAEKEDRIL